MLQTYTLSKNKTLCFQKFIFSCERSSLEHKTLESIFKNSVQKFIIIAPNSVFDCENHRGVKLITRMCVGLSHFRKQKFKHSINDTLNPICSCGFDVESTYHYILPCPMYNEHGAL